MATSGTKRPNQHPHAGRAIGWFVDAIHSLRPHAHIDIRRHTIPNPEGVTSGPDKFVSVAIVYEKQGGQFTMQIAPDATKRDCVAFAETIADKFKEFHMKRLIAPKLQN